MQKRIFDIVPKQPERVVCSRTRVFRIPLTRIAKYGFVILALGFFLGSAQAPKSPSLYASAQEETSTSTEPGVSPAQKAFAQKQEERSSLEQQLADLERQITEHQDTIAQYQKKGVSLKNEIGTLNAKIEKLNLQVKAANVQLTKLNQDINNTQSAINQNENRIEQNKAVLTKSIQALYEADSTNLAEIFLANEKLSDFFGNLTNITLVQNDLRVALQEITKIRQVLLEQKEQFAMQKEDAENLRAIQLAQKKSVEVTQKEKATLLTTTKGKETEYQKLLAKTKESASQIRNRIFQLLGGGELTFEKAYEYARLAEGATGVRSTLILAILNRESLLGKNVGRCSYSTAMHPTRDVPYFLDLLKRLGIDPKSDFAKVSCPNQHGTYGGAMGPAQFIPSTWKIYESKISQITGSNPPSPWNNSDAFVATGVYIKDLLESQSCKTYAESNKNTVPYQTLLERCASAKYYAGGNWYTYRFWYGDPVVQQANAYEKDIAVLNAG